MLRPFRDGPAFMLPVMAHVQVWGALHILPSRAIEDLFGAQLFVHWHYCPRAAPEGVRLMQRRVDQKPLTLRRVPSRFQNRAADLCQRCSLCNAPPQSAGVTARATDVHSAGGLATRPTSITDENSFRVSRGALLLSFAPAGISTYEWNKSRGICAWLPSRPTRGKRSAWRNCEQCNILHSSHSS